MQPQQDPIDGKPIAASVKADRPALLVAPDMAIDSLLLSEPLPTLPVSSSTTPAAETSPIKESPPEPSAEKNGLIERLYNPATWQERPGLIAKGARVFFKVFSRERSAWLIGSGASFTARVLAASVASELSQSRVLLPVASYCIGVAVNWPITYRLLRLQDKQSCTDGDGVLDEVAYRAGRSRRLLFLPKQEIGAAVCFGLSSVVVMSLSYQWPGLFGAFGGMAISLGTVALQAPLVNSYERIFSAIGRWLWRK